MSSYYRYLNRYAPSFLRQYQTQTYINLQRSTQYHQIVQMNATSSLTADEDLTLKYKAPYNIANLLGGIALIFWFIFHIDTYCLGTIKHRLRSYHNYKMWNRLEVMVRKHGVIDAQKRREEAKQKFFKALNITEEKYNELEQRVKDGEDPKEVIRTADVDWNLNYYPYLKL